MCYLPNFANMVCLVVTLLLSYKYPDPFFSSTYMYWYSWIVGGILMSGLNALFNPVLYFYRMTGFKDWIFRGTVKKGSVMEMSRQL